jgi:hypothetical protein
MNREIDDEGYENALLVAIVRRGRLPTSPNYMCCIEQAIEDAKHTGWI